MPLTSLGDGSVPTLAQLRSFKFSLSLNELGSEYSKLFLGTWILVGVDLVEGITVSELSVEAEDW